MGIKKVDIAIFPCLFQDEGSKLKSILLKEIKRKIDNSKQLSLKFSFYDSYDENNLKDPTNLVVKKSSFSNLWTPGQKPNAERIIDLGSKLDVDIVTLGLLNVYNR